MGGKIIIAGLAKITVNSRLIKRFNIELLTSLLFRIKFSALKQTNHDTLESGPAIYRAIMDNALIAYFISNGDGIGVEANQAASQLFGYNIEEFRHLHCHDFIDYDEAR